jgi:hypothetical protein
LVEKRREPEKSMIQMPFEKWATKEVELDATRNKRSGKKE